MKDFLWTIFETAVNLYQSVIVIYYPYKLLGTKNKHNQKTFFLSAVAIHLFILMLQDHITIADNWFTLLYFGVNIIYSAVALRGNYVKKAIASIMPLILLSIVGIFTLDFFSTISRIPVIELVQNRNILRLLLISTVQILIFFVFKISLNLLCAANDSYILKDWIKVIFIAGLSLSMGALLHHLLLYEEDENIRFIISILLGLLFITDILFFSMITYLINKNRQIKKMELIKIQQNYQNKIIYELTSQYDSIRKIRHDVKDTYQTVFSLINSNKIDEAKKLISGNYNLIDHTGIYVKTNNNILNAVVNAKLTAASTSGIKVSCLSDADINGISDLDLCDLLSNILENAITACREINDDRNKYIYLEIDKEDSIYTFLVKNSIEESILSKNPELQTTKPDKMNHGLGTAIIKDISEKYNGRCDFYEADNMFCCQVVLMTSETNSNG